MKANARTSWEKLRTSFWFVPGLMILATVALAGVTLEIDRRVDEAWVNSLPLVFHDGVEGARGLLSAVAASMITVTGVTFSVTIVAFTLASSQFTPRLLRNFMRDTGNQVVLGAFIATFSFCLCVLRVVGGPTGDFIPRISVTVAFVLTVGSVAALVYFIHHASALIQAQSIIASIARELEATLDQVYPAEAGDQRPRRPDELPEDFASDAAEVHATTSNYLEAIDSDRLLALAEQHNLVIAAQGRAGDFIDQGQVLARISPANAATPELRKCVQEAFVCGSERTQTQDPEFVLSELVEIAVRALSPSINDPATACLCVDRLGAALGKVAARPAACSDRYDESGKLRLAARHHGFAGLAAAAFNQIRQYGRESVPVTMRLLEAITRMASHVRREEDRAALLHHAQMIERGSHDAEFDPSDLEGVQRRFRAAVSALQSVGS